MKFPMPPARGERRARKPVFSRLRLAILVFSALVMAALTIDLASLRVRADRALRRGGTGVVADALVSASTATNRYADPAGRFSVLCPPDWEPQAAPGGAEDGVVLRGPFGMELAVRIGAAPEGGMPALRRRLDDIEERLRVRTSIEETTFLQRPALQRTVPLNQTTLETIDFLAGGLEVHLMISAPRETFAELRPVLRTVMESVRVGAPPGEG